MVERIYGKKKKGGCLNSLNVLPKMVPAMCIHVGKFEWFKFFQGHLFNRRLMDSAQYNNAA